MTKLQRVIAEAQQDLFRGPERAGAHRPTISSHDHAMLLKLLRTVKTDFTHLWQDVENIRSLMKKAGAADLGFQKLDAALSGFKRFLDHIDVDVNKWEIT